MSNHRVCVSGSRNFPDLGMVENVLKTLPKNTLIIHGGARGVDVEAGLVAKRLGFPTEVVIPQWGVHGKAAGPIRNREMVATADEFIAFWDESSKGTKSAIDFATQKGIPIRIVTPQDKKNAALDSMNDHQLNQLFATEVHGETLRDANNLICYNEDKEEVGYARMPDYCKDLDKALIWTFHEGDWRGEGRMSSKWRIVIYQLPSISSAGFGWYCVLTQTVSHPRTDPPGGPECIVGRNDGHPARAVVIATILAKRWEEEQKKSG